jgi:hypothetical protein
MRSHPFPSVRRPPRDSHLCGMSTGRQLEAATPSGLFDETTAAFPVPETVGNRFTGREVACRCAVGYSPLPCTALHLGGRTFASYTNSVGRVGIA